MTVPDNFGEYLAKSMKEETRINVGCGSECVYGVIHSIHDDCITVFGVGLARIGQEGADNIRGLEWIDMARMNYAVNTYIIPLDAISYLEILGSERT